MAKARPPETRFWTRVDRRSDADCWPWIGSITSTGYGCIYRASRFIGAHRLSWEMANGTAVPVGMVIRHTCDNPKCVNPAHLLVGTHADNVRDMLSRGRGGNQSKTHCCRGHEFTPENTHFGGGVRTCRTCGREKKRAMSPTGGLGSNRLKTHCLNGHAFDEANTRVSRGQRQCRACDRIKKRKIYINREAQLENERREQ